MGAMSDIFTLATMTPVTCFTTVASMAVAGTAVTTVASMTSVAAVAITVAVSVTIVDMAFVIVAVAVGSSGNGSGVIESIDRSGEGASMAVKLRISESTRIQSADSSCEKG